MEYCAEMSIRELLDLSLPQERSDVLSLPFGVDTEGQIFSRDLFSIPHTLICGVSGSGKTTFLQTLLTVAANKKSAKEIRFIVFDAKQSDYSSFNELPHMFIPTISDPVQGSRCIQWAVVEMLKRFRLFSDAKVKNLSVYNDTHSNPLPHVFIIIDDFFDLIQLASDADGLISSLQRILISGRQAGLHCIIVTAVSSNKALKKVILPNIPCKICFALSSAADSKAVLEMPNAAKLKTPGEIIYKDINVLSKVKVFYASDKEITISLNQLKCDKKPEESVAQSLLPLIESTNRHPYGGYQNENCSESESFDCEEYDEMLPAAVEVILETRNASVSMLQRRLKLGYSRCARIVDQLEEIGVVGPFEGSKPRMILVNSVQWREIANRLNLDLNVEKNTHALLL